MTILVYRDGMLAADTMIWADCLRYAETTKIGKHAGHLFGSAGDASSCQLFHAFVRRCIDEDGGDFSGFERGSDEEFEGVIVRPDGTYVFISDAGTVLDNIRGDWFAEGAAREMAYGALAAGASAEEAVKICIRWHQFAGGRTDVVMLDGLCDTPEAFKERTLQ